MKRRKLGRCPSSARLTLGAVVLTLMVGGPMMPARAVVEPTTSVTAAASTGFYTPPAPLPAGKPGSLIRREPMTAYGMPGVPLPAKAWRIMYRSTSATGKAIAVTGTVLVPKTPWTGVGRRPVIGFAVGTQGLADRCAPSRMWDAGTEYESAVVIQMLSKGWAVAVTDYPGLGTPGKHPYVVGRANGRAVLDSVRAARNLTAAGLARTGPVGIYGYSEGGNSAAWALQLQPTYAPDLPLAGGATGSVPGSDFNALLSFHDGGPFAFLLVYSAIGFNAAYPKLDLDSYLNAAGREKVKTFANTCITDAVALGLLGSKKMSDWTTSNPLTAEAWQRRIAQNTLGTMSPRTPVIIGSGLYDEAIPYAQTKLLQTRWCKRGVNTRMVTLLTVEHLLSGVAFSRPAISFLDARFKGKPLANPCAKGGGS